MCVCVSSRWLILLLLRRTLKGKPKRSEKQMEREKKGGFPDFETYPYDILNSEQMATIMLMPHVEGLWRLQKRQP